MHWRIAAGLSLSIDGPFQHRAARFESACPWPQIKLLGRDCLHLGLWLYFKKARTKVWIGIGLFGGGDILREVEKHLVADGSDGIFVFPLISLFSASQKMEPLRKS